jgi:protein ImuB
MWLAVYVPSLPLQAFSHALGIAAPVTVFEPLNRRDTVVACNRHALRLGIKPGSTLAEANTLSDRLVSLQRDPAQEKKRLHQLAAAASELTPNIHVSADFGLLLDVSASIALFGGVRLLLDRAIDIVGSEHVRTHLIVAPTARGARWLALAHRELIVTNALEDWLDDLPINCMDVAANLIRELRELNLHHLAAVRRLPAHELNQRFGTELSCALDQAYGLTGQMLTFWQPPPVFSQYVEFLDLAREQDHWMPGVIVLLQQLQGFLLQRAAVATNLEFSFCHGHQQRTVLTLTADQGVHLVDDWMRLFKARLERQSIPHEISRIELLGQKFIDADFVNTDFFDRSQTRQREWQSLLALISSRLGVHALLQSPRRNHNALPESVSASPPRACESAQDRPLRPAWLVDPPRQLQGELLRALHTTFNVRQPERVETHWSAQPALAQPQRDYYIAKAASHSIWWVFRDRATNQWFLQGIFA